MKPLAVTYGITSVGRLPDYANISPRVPVTAKLLEIAREGYTAPYETEAIAPIRRVIFEESIYIIIIIIIKGSLLLKISNC